MFNSQGLKRILSGLILGLISILEASNSALGAFLIPILIKLAAALGAVAGVHAAAAKTLHLKKYILATIAAVLAVLQYIPGMEQFAQILREIGGLLGVTALGVHIASK